MLRQDKFKVINIDYSNDKCICVLNSHLSAEKRIVIKVKNILDAKVNDEVLIEYNTFSKGQDLQGIMITIPWQPNVTDITALDWIKPKPKYKEEKEMQNHIVEIMLENFYTCGINFRNSNKVYTYKVDKNIELVEEDQVIVETTSGYEIVTVRRVDEGMDIDFNSDIKYKFIVQKLDLTKYQELCDKDKNVAAVIAQGAAQKAKQEILEGYVGALSNDQKKLLEDCGVTAIEKL